MKTYHHLSPLSDRQATRKLINQARHASRKEDGKSLSETIWEIAIVLLPMIAFVAVIIMEG